MDNNHPLDFINTGRCLQRIWLTLTKLNLSLQPITGIIYLGQSLENGQLPNIQNSLQLLIKESVNSILKTLGNTSGHVTMIFRIGSAPETKARSIKIPPLIKQSS